VIARLAQAEGEKVAEKVEQELIEELQKEEKE
jgi:hypothetical protein